MWHVGWRIAFIDNYVCESLVYYMGVVAGDGLVMRGYVLEL